MTFANEEARNGTLVTIILPSITLSSISYDLSTATVIDSPNMYLLPNQNTKDPVFQINLPPIVAEWGKGNGITKLRCNVSAGLDIAYRASCLPSTIWHSFDHSGLASSYFEALANLLEDSHSDLRFSHARG